MTQHLMDNDVAICPICRQPATGMRADLGTVKNIGDPINLDSFTQTYQPCGHDAVWKRRTAYELITPVLG